MLTAIEIENFKGIGRPVRIELRPLTLLFGPNSAGKSSILHALQYAEEILERTNLNPDRTLRGGAAVDLGSYRDLVHRHDLDRTVRLRFDFTPAAARLPDFPGWPDPQLDGFNDGLADAIGSAWVECQLGWSRTWEYPWVTGYSVGANGALIASIRSDVGQVKAWLHAVNPSHPLVQ